MLSSFRKLFRPSSYISGKALQERADTIRLYLLTGAREAWPKPPIITEEDIDELPELAELRAAVAERIRLQALTMIGAWHREKPPPLPPESPISPVDDATRNQLEIERAEAVAAAQRRAFGFELRLGPSSAGAESGSGVFLDGKALPGSVVAFYPGVTFELHDIIALPDGAKFFDGNEYLMARFDRAIIDGSHQALELLPTEARAMPLSAAQRVNHPPRASAPNVLPAPVLWDKSVPAELLEFLPNVSYERSSHAQRALLLGSSTDEPPRRWNLTDVFRDSIAQSVKPAYDEEVGPVLKGLAFVATRPIEDEELFLNYRLNPANEKPSWYEPVDMDEDQRRWAK